MKNKLSFFSLVILIISALDSMKNMPASALFGSQLVFFILIAALLFLIPTALISAELAAAFPEKGGVYQWVERAFGPRWAMAAIWLQWINTMVWYPTMLSFIAGTLAYLISPTLAENKLYLLSCILILFWGLTWINLKGIQISSRFTNVCSLLGMIFPMIFLIVLGVIWVFKGYPLQIDLSPREMIPSFRNTESWISLIAIMASFLGMELSGVHVNEIQRPQKNFPKAVLLSALFILVTKGLICLSIAMILPKEEINLISGVIQVFSNFFTVFGLQSLTPLLALFIAIGAIGTMVNWLISPAKGLLHAAEFGFLPPFFTKKNKSGVAAHILIIQAVLVSLFSLLFLFLPNINEFFWFLTALSTELYMIMYVLMFSAGLKLHYTLADRPATFKLSGTALWFFSLLGASGCLITIIISFLPPSDIKIDSFRYITMIVFGNLITLSPLLWFYRRKTVFVQRGAKNYY